MVQHLLPGIQEMRGIMSDPAFNWRWVVVLPSDINSGYTSNYSYSNNGTGGTSYAYTTSGFTSTPIVPIGRVENVTIPGLTIQSEGRFGKATKLNYPRFIEYETCAMSLYEDYTYQSLLYMRSWQNLVVDSNHNYYPPRTYKRPVYFYAFDPTNSDSPTLTVEINGCWPSTAGAGLQYEYTSSGMVTIPVTLIVDEVNYHFSQGGSLSTNTTYNSDGELNLLAQY